MIFQSVLENGAEKTERESWFDGSCGSVSGFDWVLTEATQGTTVRDYAARLGENRKCLRSNSLRLVREFLQGRVCCFALFLDSSSVTIW